MLARGLNIGLIPDGTRRWAKTNSKSLSEAYFRMVQIIASAVDWFFEQGAKSVSVYLLSRENLSRPSDQLEAVYNAEVYLIDQLLESLSKEHRFDVVFAGNLDLLPTEVAAQIRKHQKLEYDNLKKLYLCLAYNPFDELADCLSRVNEMSSGDILKNLWVPEKLDLVIRTSGEKRLSNFLPLQSSYSELAFLSRFINDITCDDLTNCLEKFQSRKRRFGQ